MRRVQLVQGEGGGRCRHAAPPGRRVQLVRRDGRDVSTLYGRARGGVFHLFEEQQAERRDEARAQPALRAPRTRSVRGRGVSGAGSGGPSKIEIAAVRVKNHTSQRGCSSTLHTLHHPHHRAHFHAWEGCVCALRRRWCSIGRPRTAIRSRFCATNWSCRRTHTLSAARRCRGPVGAAAAEAAAAATQLWPY